MVLMLSYAYYGAAPNFTTDEDKKMETSWMYNWFFSNFTWGLQMFTFILKWLFKSEGGFYHRMFLYAVKFGVVNYFVFYWATDFLIIRGT